jgi:hypothetical protein
VVLWRTVRSALVDRSRKPPEPPVAHHEKTDRPPPTRTQPTDRLPHLVHQKSTDKMDRMEDTKELAMNMKNTWLKASSQTVCTGLADRPPGARTSARTRPFEGQPFLPFTRSLESTKGKLPNHTQGEESLGDVVPTNFGASNH